MAGKSEDHRGYEISWQEPPQTSAGYDINIASNDHDLQDKLEQRSGAKGAYVISGVRNLVEGLEKARAYIKTLLD
jgi:hypothetical protein